MLGDIHHSPNGGKRNAREAAKFKRMGTRSGFPDLFLAYPNKQYAGLFIELKAEGGKAQQFPVRSDCRGICGAGRGVSGLEIRHCQPHRHRRDH